MATNLGDLLAAAGFTASAPEEAPAAETPDAPRETEPGFAAKVIVRTTRKGRGGRTVTLVQGVTEGHQELAGLLKRALGAGVRVEGDEVVVQGDQADRVIQWLQARPGMGRVQRG